MSGRRWTEKHGADGLRRKFDVYKPADGSTIRAGFGEAQGGGREFVEYPADARIGADGEFIFVLRPETDREAALALARYADSIPYRAPELADQIHAELRRINEKEQNR